MKASNLPIIISGAGIGGLTTALALARKNIPSIVLEQAAEIRETGAGLQICPNATKVFDFLGLSEVVDKIAYYPTNLVYIDGFSQKEIAKIPLGKESIDYFKHPYGIYHRENLIRALHEECRKTKLVEIVTSAKLNGFEDLETHVKATTENGLSLEGAALIGADGLWSFIRKEIVNDGLPKFSGLITYRGVVSYKDVPKHFHSTDTFCWVKPAHLIYYPIHGGELFNVVAVYYSEKPRSPDDISANIPELYENFKDSPAEMMDLLAMVDTSRAWMLCDRDPVSKWSRGRVTLMGDAAHPTLPHLTQGAGMAIEDAAVLANKIAKHGTNYAAAFVEYEQARYLRTARIQLYCRFYKQLFNATGAARELRNQMISQWSTKDYYNWYGWGWHGVDLNS